MPANALTITEKSLRLLGASLTLYVATKLPPSLNLRINVLEKHVFRKVLRFSCVFPLGANLPDPHFDKQ
jgi:hypothetical protein